ncbi:NVEALA domain-containing protein [Capnocytophaga canis]|uniref:Uncharacterized protein n=1 Tax=Capnocytophaga canis TaxID=1848903 RepID=A0A0B7HZN2_9FLAO|nr:NVEALA domain-containing protein [Capnocytophaga canis]CEN44044.1 hypothetical protein CCAND38_150042 [Capnocytophaga canis]
MERILKKNNKTNLHFFVLFRFVVYFCLNKFLKGVIAIAVVALVADYGISRSVNNRNAELSDLTLANLEALTDEEGCGGLAKLSDPIWYVTVEIGGNVSFPKMTCTTGGCYKCSSK